MGFLLSILYFVTYYLTPATLFGPLAAAHIELILAALVVLVSLPSLARSLILKTPQSLAVIGLGIAAVLSMLVAMHWPGGAVQAFLEFIPNAFAYFLVCMHCGSKKKIQTIVFMLLFVCLFVIAHGYSDMLHGTSGSNPLQTQAIQGAEPNLQEMDRPYFMVMMNNERGLIYRLRGLGEIHDPNDFGQLIVCVIPLVFIFWRPKRMIRNIAVVMLPVCALLFGVFLTHSRGALLALMAIAVMAARRRIGTLPALLLAGGLFVTASALHFTGGRDISAESGSDRTDLWGESLQLLKTHPLFGVGDGQLPDHLGHTAHNSVMVCAAELGLVGLYFWSLFLFPTVRDALQVASPLKITEGVPIKSEEGLFPLTARKIEVIDKADVNRLGRLLVLSLTGFLVTGWFLSRAFVMTLFLLGGMVEVVYEMALQRGMISPRLRMGRVIPYAAILAVLLIVLVYFMLRVLNFMH